MVRYLMMRRGRIVTRLFDRPADAITSAIVKLHPKMLNVRRGARTWRALWEPMVLRDGYSVKEIFWEMPEREVFELSENQPDATSAST